ncbi:MULTISPECIES: YciI family protein [unclassified Micromonospora]|uniref:YciI family protein n=1 Tax=unclassified Micromonospora TaxID=2617518 RepID=UPI001C5CCEEA|nr:YciI family protein [Micromonospora sp. RL09-050-HVF-A]MBW4701533.1 YciI family protein [Micromonospora sp. RL09-050-HVF-A]
MKYLILISHNEQARDAWQDMSDTERQLGVKAHAALVEDLAAAGELIVSEALADPATARRVRVDRGRTIATDGPFPEVKEYLAGFYLVECDTIEQAVAHAARVPEAQLGLVEVRPVLDAARPDA